MTAKDIGPLTWNSAITDGQGRPTPEFQRRWNTQRTNNALIGSVSFGSGPPSGMPSDGALYVDTSVTPMVLYIGDSGSYHVLGVQAFTDLSDVPHSYTGLGHELVRVNAGATGLEFFVPTANPTAVAGDIAVNGSALTFMRSDGAPAVQKGLSTQFGIVKVDGTTITSSGGIISSVSSSSGGGAVAQFDLGTSSQSSSAFAYKGITFLPEDNITVSAIGMGLVNNSISNYGGVICQISSSTSTTPTIVTVNQTNHITFASFSTIQWCWLPFASPITMVAGTPYAIMVGYTSGAGTAVLPIAQGLSRTIIPALPGNAIFPARLASTNPTIGAALDTNSGAIPSTGVAIRWT